MTKPPSGNNAVSFEWFRAHRGHHVVISPVPNLGEGEGILRRWDHYSVLLESEPGVDILIKQGPGMTFRCVTCNEGERE